MKTLPKAITRTFFKDELQGWDQLRAAWKQHLATPPITPVGGEAQRRDHYAAARQLLYAALRGKDWRKGFTAPTNETKLRNGYRWELENALAQVRANWTGTQQAVLEPFKDILVEDALPRIKSLLPDKLPTTVRTVTPGEPIPQPHKELPDEAYEMPGL